MAETHLQVNLNGTTSYDKTNLLPQNKEVRIGFLTSLFTRNNWEVKSIQNVKKGLWKIIVKHPANLEFHINLLFSTIRDEKRQPDEFKTQYGEIEFPLFEEEWVDIPLGVYVKEEDTPIESCILSAFFPDGLNFPGNPSMRGVRTKGLQLAQSIGMVENDSCIIFRPEFIYHVVNLFSMRQSNVYREQMKNLVAESLTVYATYPQPLQQIFFGAPGVGKSHYLKSVYKSEDDAIRITFHPETDYSSFVGCYKPQTEDNDDNKDIVYKFQGQAFTDAYVKAWKRYFGNDEHKDTFLIIEEINRGNCAQIFGDIFQLLDRNEQGFSDYSVIPDKDLQQYLSNELNIISSDLNKINNGLGNGMCMILPPNLHILATMNTSDQSLFPIDSAFKRRWDWVYMPIETKPIDDKGEIITRRIITEENSYDWGEFLDNVNQRIFKTTESEDKQLGFWFVKPKSGDTTISAEDFVSKVIFFLWNDIYKDFGDDASSIFNFAPDGNPESKEKERHSFKDFSSGFKKVNVALVDAFIKSLRVLSTNKTPDVNSTETNAE